MTMKKSIIFVLISIAITGCAKISIPTGGPRDEQPPVVVKTNPPSGTTFFKSKSIKITFNEFVTINNASQTVIMSPPIETNLDLTTQNKSVIIKIPDTLRSNTTYNIAMVGTIKDYTEGNPLPFYNYTFSTGDHIDSFQLHGVLIDASTLEPVKETCIMLYDNDIDSLPLTTRPTYITKTQSNGHYTFNNIKPQPYKIFALEDINSNLIYDLPNERLAFCDSTVTAWRMPKEPDTLITDKDTTIVRYDTVSHADIILKLFSETDTTQAIEKYINKTEGIYIFPFKNKLTDFKSTYIKGKELSFFETIVPTNDTLIWYLKEALADTAYYELSDGNKVKDTVKILPFKKNDIKSSRKKESKQSPLSVSISNQEDLYKPLTLNFSYPIKPLDDFEMIIIKPMKKGNDTIIQKYNVPDTFVRSLALDYPFEGKVRYNIFIKDSTFYGYNNSTNDTIQASFTRKSEKEYGNLRINYSLGDPNHQFIVTLLNEGGKSIQEDIITSKCVIDYLHLTPGKYKVKVIKDATPNGIWDTGNYGRKEQPETIYFFEKEFTVRGYWDIEEDFELK